MSDITINNALSSVNSRPTLDNESKGRKVVSEDQNKTIAQDQNDSVSISEAASKSAEKDLENASKDGHAEEKEVSGALKERNEKMAKERMDDLNCQNIGLAFSVDKESENTVVKVTDLNTEKLVRQIPSEEFLEFAEKLDNMKKMNQAHIAGNDANEAKGLLFDEKA